MYSYTQSKPRRQIGMAGQRHPSAALTPGKNTDTHFTGGCVGPGKLWMGEEKKNSFAPKGVKLRTVEYVACCYTDCHIPAHFRLTPTFLYAKSVFCNVFQRTNI
jgi:hypothetical protein